MSGPQSSSVFYERIEKHGFRGKIISIEHVRELETEIMNRYHTVDA